MHKGCRTVILFHSLITPRGQRNVRRRVGLVLGLGAGCLSGGLLNDSGRDGGYSCCRGGRARLVVLVIVACACSRILLGRYNGYLVRLGVSLSELVGVGAGGLAVGRLVVDLFDSRLWRFADRGALGGGLGSGLGVGELILRV